MSRHAQENLVGVIVLAVFVVLFVLTLGYSSRARLVPLPVCILGIVLSVAQLLWQNLRSIDDLRLNFLDLAGIRGTVGTAAMQPRPLRTPGNATVREPVQRANPGESYLPSASSQSCSRWCSWPDRYRPCLSSPRDIWA